MAESAPAPRTILRGHKAQVHAAAFVRNNERLLTGDADGFVVLWDLTIMRPRAVWRAHENAILGLRGWGQDKVITHGRDHKLVVWKLGAQDEERMSVALPLEDVPEPRLQPWILHILEVNTMNFCSFAACPGTSDEGAIDIDSASEIFVALPNTLASEAIDVWSLPSQSRVYTIRPGQKNGMAMSLSLLQHEGVLTLICAFENGFASVHRFGIDCSWTMTYRSQAHSQPILSVDVGPECAYFLTSSADSLIAKHPIPTTRQEVSSDAVTTSTSSDARVVEIEDEGSSTLQQQASSTGKRPAGRNLREWEHPLKVVNTKHSGQQSLKVRSDGKIFATAGWDSKVRVYSTKTLKELAVLQWHKVGAYAVAFSVIRGHDILPTSVASTAEAPSNSIIRAGITSVKDRRIQFAKTAHWIAAGAKDGNVSLWDIY